MKLSVRHFIEAVAAWDAGYTNAQPVVDAAAELLVAGTGETAVAMLAGTPSGVAELEVPYLIEAALEDAGVEWPLGDTERNAIVTSAVAARRYLAGEISARGLCTTVHERHGHDSHPLVEALSILDDAFDNVELAGWNHDHIVQEVDAAASALIAGEKRLLDGATPGEL